MLKQVSGSFLGSSLKIILLGLLDAISILAVSYLFYQGGTGLGISLILGTFLINLVFLIKRTYPLRYMIPGLIFLSAFVVYPIGYTAYIAFTNYGTSHILTKQQAIKNIENSFYQPKNPRSFSFNAYKNEKGEYRVVLFERGGETVFVTGGKELVKVDIHSPRFIDSDQDGTIEKFNDFNLMKRNELIKALSTLQKWRPERGKWALQMTNLSTFEQIIQRYEYRSQKDTMLDRKTDEVFIPVEGTFVSKSSKRKLTPGFKTTIGLKNFVQIFTNPLITKPFIRVFIWTFIWAFMGTLTTFSLGLAAALLLNDRELKLRKLYKSLLILPYAIPVFISALMWRGFFNTSVGIINTKIFEPLFGLAIPWFQDPLLAKIAVLIVNLWLGFPYMMVISLGALQSIPPELYAAARVDGASVFQQFRKITLPLLMVSVAPLLIGNFAFNFNNFNNIYLVTQGDPPMAGANTAGATDILISYTYKLAFGGQGATYYGLSAAIAIIIFLIIGTISAVNFKFTGALEEISSSM